MYVHLYLSSDIIYLLVRRCACVCVYVSWQTEFTFNGSAFNWFYKQHSNELS